MFFIHQLLLDHFPVLLPSSKVPQSELSDPDTPSFDTMFQPAEAPGQTPTNTRDYEDSYNSEPSMPMGKADYFNDQGTTELLYTFFKYNVIMSICCASTYYYRCICLTVIWVIKT